MTAEEMREKAIQVMMKRFHRSQCVLEVGQEKLGRRDEEVIKAMGTFGGGLGETGEVCGALRSPHVRKARDSSASWICVAG